MNSTYAAAGISLGLCFGAALGAAMHDVGVGIAMGVAIGVAFLPYPGAVIGGSQDRRRARLRRLDPSPPTETEAFSRFPALDHVPFQKVVGCSDARSF